MHEGAADVVLLGDQARSDVTITSQQNLSGEVTSGSVQPPSVAVEAAGGALQHRSGSHDQIFGIS